ncbi:GNAT family N-acetyltransferase [Candidatus Nitrospira bockiana]
MDLTLEQWGDVLERFDDRTIFQTPEWLGFIAETQRAEPVFARLTRDGECVGYCAGLIVKRFGMRILGSPLPGWTTSYMGPNLLPGLSRREAADALIGWAFDGLGCVHVEVMDRQLSVQEAQASGWTFRRYEGFEVDLTQGEDALLRKMTGACRRCLRQSAERGVTIEEARDETFADEYYLQLREVFGRQRLVPPYGLGRVRELIRRLDREDRLLLLRARDAGGRCLATGIFPAMNRTMYFWGGASRRAFLHYRPNEAIQWYAIRYWKARGIERYDMGGGGEYKRRFGGERIRVPWLRSSKYPWIGLARNMAKRAAGWRQRIGGRTCDWLDASAWAKSRPR